MKKECKHCGHDEEHHVRGVGCKGAFAGQDLSKIDPESLFYGECLCRNFEEKVK
jgi:hypothetical protein